MTAGHIIDRSEQLAGVESRRAFSNALRELRGRRGIGQEALALEAGVDRTFVSGLERGLHDPTLRTMLRLRVALGVSLRQMARAIEKHLADRPPQAKRPARR